MTERCEPPEELRDRDGWHWLMRPDGTAFLAQWETPEWWPETQGAWRIGSGLVVPAPAYRRGYRYGSPVVTPAEADALRAENAQLRQALDKARDIACEGVVPAADGAG